MQIKIACLLLVPLALAGCTEPVGPTEPGATVTLPESIVAMAAPDQDLASVRVMPEDGCLWYRHVGPVETTLLPLRTTDGRPICTRTAS